MPVLIRPLYRHTTLLEVLELPQLMETVVRNQHYEEALELQVGTSDSLLLKFYTNPKFDDANFWPPVSATAAQAYVVRLVKRQGGVGVLEDIGRAVQGSMALMLSQLLHQLRAPVQLPQCLKVSTLLLGVLNMFQVISYLRRLDVYGEQELRLVFLQAREAWLDSVVAGVAREDPSSHLTGVMEAMRVHLFDIVTQVEEESSMTCSTCPVPRYFL